MEQVQKKSPHFAAQVMQSPQPSIWVVFCWRAEADGATALTLFVSARASTGKGFKAPAVIENGKCLSKSKVASIWRGKVVIILLKGFEMKMMTWAE